MIANVAMAIGLLVASGAASAQTAPPTGDSELEKMLAGTSTYKINGTCNRLLSPEGDQTAECDKELINVAFPSGNSSFIATTRKGGVSFRGRDSAAKGDVATIRLTSVILTTDLSTPPVEIKAKGQCTYTNPNKGPIHVDCSADTANGKYELSFVSDGVWPPQ
jgi:hypothetical protein